MMIFSRGYCLEDLIMKMILFTYGLLFVGFCYNSSYEDLAYEDLVRRIFLRILL